jgi:tRNA 2-thiouridine synthesizing protein C
MKRRILILARKPPYGSAIAQELLDATLVAGVFEQAVSVLFTDDGVFQLLRGQRGDMLGTRDIAKALTALPTYEVDALYASADALSQRGLTTDDLAMPVQVLDRDGIAALLGGQDVVISG